jgi:hypothetical protein
VAGIPGDPPANIEDSGGDHPFRRPAFWPNSGPNVLGAIGLVPNLCHVPAPLEDCGGPGETAADSSEERLLRYRPEIVDHGPVLPVPDPALRLDERCRDRVRLRRLVITLAALTSAAMFLGWSFTQVSLLAWWAYSLSSSWS